MGTAEAKAAIIANMPVIIAPTNGTNASKLKKPC